ncbi:MAG: hypothetical protein KGD65_05860 [Candidatus Lokiarchaeota archaeon]|nr:hypothetical protein [Candidatus Lokiarchaeota archaeon]
MIEQEKVENDKIQIFATVFLRSRVEKISLEKDGKKKRDAYNQRPSTESFSKVRKELEKIGFNIISQGGNNFTIHSSRNHFEEVFGIKLNQKETPLFKEKAQPTVKLYFTEEIIKIPENLKDLVERITLPKFPYPTSSTTKSDFGKS